MLAVMDSDLAGRDGPRCGHLRRECGEGYKGSRAKLAAMRLLGDQRQGLAMKANLRCKFVFISSVSDAMQGGIHAV
jgi:hypothetical protein